MTRITLSDLLAQETKNSPHAFYAQVRSTEPMVYVEGLDSWLLTTYEDALWLLKLANHLLREEASADHRRPGMALGFTSPVSHLKQNVPL
jgi:hypothetical protein